MPRTYHRKSDIGQVPHSAMLEAVREVQNGTSVRKVSMEKGISKSALSRYVIKFRQDESTILAPNYRHSQIFNAKEENLLEEYLLTCSAMFHGLTPNNVRRLAYEMACRNNIQMPAKWSETQEAGKDWLNGYLKRHPSLGIRSPEATSLARATAFNMHNINAYFDVLESVIRRLNAGGQVIFNLDESGCTTVQRVPKVVTKKGSKQVGQVTSRDEEN